MKPYLSSALVPSYIMRWGENLDGVDIISRGRSKTFTRGCPLNVRRGFVVCSRVQKRGDYAGIISERMWTKYLLARAETSGRLVAFVSYPGKDISCSSTCVGTGGRSIGEDHQKKTSNVHQYMHAWAWRPVSEKKLATDYRSISPESLDAGTWLYMVQDARTRTR